MLHIFRVTDGTRTVNLLGRCRHRNYVPQTGERGKAEVVESFDVYARGAAALADLQMLEQLLHAARAYENDRTGVPVWVELQRTSTSRLLRSRILDGSKANGDGFAFWQTRERKDAVTIQWTRWPYWESAALMSVPLANHRATTPSTSGLRLQNGFSIPPVPDAIPELDNTAQIAANTIIGTLPAPARIELYVLTAEHRVNTVYIGHGVARGDNTYNLYWTFEAERGTTSDAGVLTYELGHPQASNDGGMLFQWSDNAWHKLRTWPLGADDLAIANGGYFRIMGRALGQPADIWAYATVDYLNYRMAATTPALINGHASELIDFGTLPLPPAQHGTPNLANLKLSLWGRAQGGADLNLDYVMALPTDGWRQLSPMDSGATQYVVIVDDPDSGNVYSAWGAQGNFGNYIGDGELLLQPGVAQRLQVLHTATTTDTWRLATPTRELQIAVRYRPRWDTI